MYCAGAWGVINILTDQYPDETRWTLSRITTTGGASINEIVLEGDPDSSETLFTNEVCLDGGDYVFVIYDDACDGIFSPGYYEVIVEGKIVARNGAFYNFLETISFSVPFTATVPKTADPNAKPCEDTHDGCKGWASLGECEHNPDYMLMHCPISCDSCPEPERELLGTIAKYGKAQKVQGEDSSKPSK